VREAIGIGVAVWLLAGCASNMPAPTTTNPMFSEAQQCMRGGECEEDSANSEVTATRVTCR
jgi:hypothetical protein